MDAGYLLFFDGHDDAVLTAAALYRQVMDAWPGSGVKVQKSMITFLDPRGYCYLSLPRRKGMPGVVVSFGLGYRLESPRLLAVSHPAPGRYTHHVHAPGPQALNEELMGWLAQSHDFMRGRLAR